MTLDDSVSDVYFKCHWSDLGFNGTLAPLFPSPLVSLDPDLLVGLESPRLGGLVVELLLVDLACSYVSGGIGAEDV